MRRRILAVLIGALVIVLAVSSVVKVPVGGGAICRGRYLGPGTQLKIPFTKVSFYQTGQASSNAKQPG